MAGKLSNIRIKELKVQELPDINLDLELAGHVGVGVTELPDISVGVSELPDANLNLAVTELPTLDIKSDSDLRTESTVSTNSVLDTTSKVDLTLDLRVTELPRIDLQFGFRPMRFHLPLNYRFCISLFGFRILEFETCGEAMVVSEDYKPLSSEECR